MDYQRTPELTFYVCQSMAHGQAETLIIKALQAWQMTSSQGVDNGKMVTKTGFNVR